MTRRTRSTPSQGRASPANSPAFAVEGAATGDGKVTSPGWPDPTEWINRLYQVMAERQANYEVETDTLIKRNKAGGMLGQVIKSLLELSAFKNDSVHLPLKDLMIFLSDLDRGRDHPWSAPVNFGGTNATATARSELKIWVRAAFAVLRANGFKPVEAYRRIATGLTKSGREGRTGAPVRWQLVQTWCREAETPHDKRIRPKLEAWWVEYCPQISGYRVVDARGEPVPVKDIAGLFVDKIWSLPHLRDRSISGGSE